LIDDEASQDWHPAIRSITEAAPYIRQFPGYAADPLETWSFHDRIVLVGDAAHGHGGAFAAGGSLAINDAHALSLALFHVWPPSASSKKPSVADLHKVFEIYQATRKRQVDRLLDSVHKSVAGRRVKTDNGTEETDEQLRKRVSERMDPFWVAEHDVEAAFEAVVASSGHQVLGNKPPQALL
jgi:salicylate hydroxylase